jgi:hypothetical protein
MNLITAMKKSTRLLTVFAVAFAIPCVTNAIPYTWTGATADLSLDTNWNPLEGPPSAFGDDAIFDATGTTKTGLSPNGAFSAINMTFTNASYSFGSKGGGDIIGIGDGTGGTLIMSSAASLSFNDHDLFLDNPMTWSITGNSSFTSSGSVDSSNKALGIGFGVGETNVTLFTNLNLGTTGSLLVSNWGGSLGAFGGANNQLRFSGDPTAILDEISFSGFTEPAGTQDMGGYWEVAPVPEPSTWLLAAVAFTVALTFRRRSRV